MLILLLPLDDQWLSQASELLSIFVALLVQYHSRYHAKVIDYCPGNNGITHQ